jgi:NADH-quinone oxidoreductase subunit J
MNGSLILFWVLAVLSVVTALGVVLHRNPIRSALLLIVNFCALAVFYVMLNAQVLAVLQILVYAGAIMVLFLFVIMLLNLGNDHENDFRGIPWRAGAVVTGLGMFGVLTSAFVRGYRPPLGEQAGRAALENAQAMNGTVGLIGMPLYQDFMIPLQATAILLLIACVGAVVLAKRKV